MTSKILAKDDVWYVDIGSSNHMASCGEWFRDMHKQELLGFVHIGGDTAHPIAHVGDVSLNTQDGKSKYLACS